MITKNKMNGAERIAAEIKRQIEKEGWDAEYDDEQEDGQLASAAACYALQNYKSYFQISCYDNYFIDLYDILWPWDEEYWKPTHVKIRNLEKAVALISAEIDRLLRLETKGGKKWNTSGLE